MNFKRMIVMGLTGVTLLAGCGQAGTNSDQTSKEGSETMSSEIIDSKKDEQTILYKGTILDQEENSKGGLLIKDLTPVDDERASKFDEVLLLMNEEIPLTDQETGKNLKVTDVQEGDSVEVTLVENVPSTRSLPPQIPGNGIVKVEVVSP